MLFLLPRSGGNAIGARKGDLRGSGSEHTTISPGNGFGHSALSDDGIANGVTSKASAMINNAAPGHRR